MLRWKFMSFTVREKTRIYIYIYIYICGISQVLVNDTQKIYLYYSTFISFHFICSAICFQCVLGCIIVLQTQSAAIITSFVSLGFCTISHFIMVNLLVSYLISNKYFDKVVLLSYFSMLKLRLWLYYLLFYFFFFYSFHLNRYMTFHH